MFIFYLNFEFLKKIFFLEYFDFIENFEVFKKKKIWVIFFNILSFLTILILFENKEEKMEF